jgi:parallel beta-helix repeat protein
VLVQSCSSGQRQAGLSSRQRLARPIVRECIARNNGTDGLFLCWRVRHGLFTDNLLEGNGQFGISIGHKDSDNLLRSNIVRSNHQDGIFFATDTSGHRNRLENSLIEITKKATQGIGCAVKPGTSSSKTTSSRHRPRIAQTNGGHR